MMKYVQTFTRLLAIAILPFLIGMGGHVSAVDVVPACTGTASQTELCQNIKETDSTENPIIRVIGVTITILSIIIGVAAIIMIIIGGLSMITANGDAQAVARARSSVIYALVGLVLAGLAPLLVNFILDKL